MREATLTQPTQAACKTDLRDLQDAYGLALLVKDDTAAEKLAPLLSTWQDTYAQTLKQDPQIQEIDKRSQRLFKNNLAGRTEPARTLSKTVASIPREQMERTLSLWLKSLFHRNDVFFPKDLEKLTQPDVATLCKDATDITTRKGLSTWRYRVLLWKWRDSQVCQAFEKRNERLAELTPIQIDMKTLDPLTRQALEKYLPLLANLKVQVLRNRELPYEKHRTLKGLLNGLQYMKTIREAAALTDLPHRMMTALFIQESEFIHQRVSVAGAFSVAQFLNIAVRDVWLFRKKIQGSSQLLQGVSSSSELKKKMIQDPHVAIRTAFLYFRRVRDYIATKLGNNIAKDIELVNLISMEMFTAKSSLMHQSYTQAMHHVSRSIEEDLIDTLFSVPIAGIVVPEPGSLLSHWTMRTIQDTLQERVATKVFDRRMDSLLAALGLASYNAGMGNIKNMGKRKGAFASLSFPLQIDETRGYVDSILDAWNILSSVESLGSKIELLDFQGLLELTQKACSLSKNYKRNAS